MKKKNSFLKYTILFLIFLLIGIAIGVFGSKWYFARRPKAETPTEEKAEEEKPVQIVNISDDSSYSALINELYTYLDRNPMYYTSKGFDITTASNDVKLSLTYQYMISNKKDTIGVLASSWDGTTCPFNDGLNSFIVDGPGLGCTVSSFTQAQMLASFKKVFGDVGLDVTANFIGKDGKMCILVGDIYTCGRTTGGVYTGSLTPKMDVLKVEKHNEDIVFTEKGYLQDTRSNVTNGEPNNYLHSSDSTDYYHELKSSDNLYFIHTFKKNEDGTYTYLKTTTREKKDS